MPDLRREARQLETEVDGKLLQLSKCDGSDGQDEGGSGSDKVPLLQTEATFGRLSRDIESLLSRLTEVNERMSSVADRMRSSSATYTLQRHRDILNDYTKEFRKTKTSGEVSHDREKLFQTSGAKGETVIPMNGTQAMTLLSREAESARK